MSLLSEQSQLLTVHLRALKKPEKHLVLNDFQVTSRRWRE